MLTGSWQAVFKNVDFPADGRPIIATTAVLSVSVDSIKELYHILPMYTYPHFCDNIFSCPM